jgi:phage terminase small subunit
MKSTETNLTEKQTLFCYIYLQNSFNATQAAIEAGYSENIARQQGYENLAKPDVKAFIEKLMTIKMKSANVIMETNDIIAGIAKIANDDATNPATKLKAFEMLGRNRNFYEEEKETEARTITIIDASTNKPLE